MFDIESTLIQCCFNLLLLLGLNLPLEHCRCTLLSLFISQSGTDVADLLGKSMSLLQPDTAPTDSTEI